MMIELQRSKKHLKDFIRLQRNYFIEHQKHGFGEYFYRQENTSTFAALMLIEVLKSKIHNVTVTQTELRYVGSITIDENLMDAANMIEGEKVLIVNNSNGERLETYIIKGERGCGCICLNGAAARKAQRGDQVIIISFAHMEFEKAKSYSPTIIFPDSNNKLVS